jgi:hypothetical protein
MANMERVKGIEPSYSAWKAAALPLSYTRAAELGNCAAPQWQGQACPRNQDGNTFIRKIM